MKKVRPRITQSEYDIILRVRKYKGNILVIPDLHAPFTLEKFLPFCKMISKKYNCEKVVFLGDLVDNHFSSFHDNNPDMDGAGKELDKAIEIIAEYHEAFPNAKVCVGNHDAIPDRKAFAGGLSNRWIKDMSEVLDTPTWTYSEEHIIDNILFTHGTGRQAKSRCLQEGISVAQGHFHSKSYIEFFQHRNDLKFAMQLGCGIDRDSMAFAYGKNFAVPQLNIGIIKNNVPIIIPFS